MLMIFNSPASGDVVLFEENGKALLGVLGENPGSLHGVVTPEKLPAALKALKAAIEANQTGQPESPVVDVMQAPAGVEMNPFPRALPLLELLERSLRDKVPVSWGI